MLTKPPCGKCERKGCGSYHDVCKEYQEWKRDYEKSKAPREQHRDYIKKTTYKSRTGNIFKSHKK